MRTLYCEKCGTTLIVAEKGSKIKKGVVCLCATCWEKYKAAEFAMRNRNVPVDDIFTQMFGGKKCPANK
jgi:DNA-directed RNA polymerase subunit M/transcription elongation factor TFIIS